MEGNEWGGGGDEPTDSKQEPSDFEEEEEDEEEEEMDDQNLEWMTQGPLTLLGALYKIPKQVERMSINFNLDNIVKVEDHLDNLYLQLQTLEVWYNDVACRLFPCTLDGHAAAWYRNLLTNSIQNCGAFKRMFLEKFSNDKIPTMLLK